VSFGKERETCPAPDEIRSAEGLCPDHAGGNEGCAGRWACCAAAWCFPADHRMYLTSKERDDRVRAAIGPQVWINPLFKPLSETKVKFLEGCLSVPGVQAIVERFEEVELRGLDEDGGQKEPLRLTGWPARIVQHEIDHLKGILYVDRMDSKTLVTQGHLAWQEIEDLKALLGV
jgi:peptide deformylase